MAANRFAGVRRLECLQKSALNDPVGRAFKHSDRHFGAWAGLVTKKGLAHVMKPGAALLIALAANPSNAQAPMPRAASTTTTAPSATTADAATATAAAPSFRVVPMFEITERYTDNAEASTSLPQSDWLTDAAAGLRVEYRAARANAQLDYRLDRLLYRQRNNLNSTQHLLNSSAIVEAVEKWLFVDARASVTQQNRSAFDVAGISDITSSRANRIETTTYQIAPYVRGNFANAATYLLRVNGAETRTGESAFPDTRTYDWNGFVKNAPSAGPLGWSIDGNAFSVDNNAVGTRRDSRVRATLTFEIDPQMHVSVSAGKETADLSGLEKSTTSTYGYGFEWSPSERTRVAAVTQRRFFGNDHLVVIGHRTPLTAWSVSSAREVAVSTNELAGSNPGSVNNLLLDLLASTISDPSARAAAAQQRLEQTGIPASSGIQEGFLTVRPFLSLRQEASAALRGSRNTITIAVGRREQRAFEGNNVTPGSGAPLEEYRQVSANMAWAYRLSPVSTLRMVISHFRTEGLFVANLTATERLQSVFFVTQLGPQTSVSLGLQRVLFDSTVANSYRENAFVSTLSVRF